MLEQPSTTNKDKKPSANTTMTGAAVPVFRPSLRTTGSRRHVAQSPPVDSTMFQQCLLMLLAGTAAAYMAMRLVWAVVRSLPFVAVGVYYSKPSLESFMEFLSLKDKRSSSSSSEAASTSSPRTGSGKPGGWLKKVVSKTIDKTSAALCLNPVREWLYLDLGLIVVCKKKPSAFEGLSAALCGGAAPPEPKVFAIGLCFQWFWLDPSTCDSAGEWSWWKIYVYELACLLSQVSDAKWNTFSSFPAVQRRNDTQRSATVEAVVATTVAVVGEAWKEVVEASNQSNNSSSSSSSNRNSSSRNTHSSGSSNVSSGGVAVAGIMGEMEDKPMKRYMSLAQEMAERGRFEEAGRAVEMGFEKTRGVLRGGIEEETEVLLVACAFYEAGSPSSYQCATSRLRCLEQAAELCVVQERWAKASELFEECVMACMEDQKKRGHALGVMGQIVLSAVLAQYMFGDPVRAEGFHRQVCGVDARYQKTGEAELVTELLKGIHTHNPKVIQEAKVKYQTSKEGERERGRTLEHWQEQVVRHMMKRADAAVLL